MASMPHGRWSAGAPCRPTLSARAGLLPAARRPACRPAGASPAVAPSHVGLLPARERQGSHSLEAGAVQEGRVSSRERLGPGPSIFQWCHRRPSGRVID